MAYLRRVHLFTAVLFLVVFVATGQYMDLAHDHLRGMADGARLMFRSGHIYLLFAALLNLMLGLYLVPHEAQRARLMQALGSGSIVLLPALLTVSFFVESGSEALSRPVAAFGIYAALVGAGLHVFSGLTPKP